MVKVGRKYVTVAIGRSEELFLISTGEEKTDYSPTSWVLPSMQAFNDSEEAAELYRKIRDSVNADTHMLALSLDKLRQIWAIIEEQEIGSLKFEPS